MINKVICTRADYIVISYKRIKEIREQNKKIQEKNKKLLTNYNK